jgi:hypothetical protein
LDGHEFQAELEHSLKAGMTHNDHVVGIYNDGLTETVRLDRRSYRIPGSLRDAAWLPPP